MAPREPDPRPVFVGREQVIKDIFDNLKAGVQVVLVTGQHWSGKTALLQHLYSKISHEEPRLIPGLATVKTKNESILPLLEATASLLPELDKRVKTKSLPAKTRDFLQGIRSGRAIQKLFPAGVADGATQVGAGGLGKAAQGIIVEGLVAASPSLGIEMAMATQRRAMSDIFLKHLTAVTAVTDRQDRIVLFLDQIERGREALSDLLGDLLINFPVNVSLVMAINVGMAHGAKLLQDLNDVLTEIDVNKISLPGLEEKDIFDLFKRQRGLEFDAPFLKKVKKSSGGLPGLLVQWMETPDFRARDLEGLRRAKTKQYGYYRTMIEQLDNDARKMVQLCCVLKEPLPNGRVDLAEVLRQDVDGVATMERRLVRDHIFRDFPDKKMAWFAHELLHEFVSDSWCVKEVREENAARLINFFRDKYGSKLTVQDDPELFAEYAGLLRMAGTSFEAWQANTNLAQHYFQTADYDLSEEAVDIAQEAVEEEIRQGLDQDQQKENKRRLAVCFGLRGLIQESRGEYDQALEFYTNSWHNFEDIGGKSGLADTYTNIGNIHKARDDYDRALEFYEKARSIFNEIGDKAGLAGTYNNIANIHLPRGDYDRALEFYEKAKSVFEEIDNEAGLSGIYNNIAIVHLARGEYNRALEFYEKARPVFERIGDRASLATTYNNIGEAYRLLGEYDRALDSYDQSIAIKEDIGDKAGLAQTYINRGNVYQERGEYERALELYKKAMPIFDEIVDRYALATTYSNIGVVYQAKGEWDQALAFYKKSIAIKEEIGQRAGLAMTFGNIGFMYFKLEQYQKAAPYALAAMIIFESLVLNPNIEKAQRQVAAIVNKLGFEAFEQAIDNAPPELKKYLPEKIEFESEE